MPYDEKTDDRAMARLMADLSRTPTPPPKRNAEAGIGLCLALLMLILGLCLLLSVGCNTIAGVGQDLHDLAEGTRQQLADDPPPMRYSER